MFSKLSSKELLWGCDCGYNSEPHLYLCSALSRDPSVFDSPEEFIPERYESNPGLPSGLTATFGFGRRCAFLITLVRCRAVRLLIKLERRVCPGQDFAEAMIFIAAATLLATTNMLPPLDGNGKPVIPPSEYSGVLAK